MFEPDKRSQYTADINTDMATCQDPGGHRHTIVTPPPVCPPYQVSPADGASGLLQHPLHHPHSHTTKIAEHMVLLLDIKHFIGSYFFLVEYSVSIHVVGSLSNLLVLI